MHLRSGDFQESRVKNDLNELDWAQHVFRYFTGHMQNSLRGHRLLWAAFNTALQSFARKSGSLLHRRSRDVRSWEAVRVRTRSRCRFVLVVGFRLWARMIETVTKG